MTMDWLAENVIGTIPPKEELKEQAEPVIKQQGVMKKEGQPCHENTGDFR